MQSEILKNLFLFICGIAAASLGYLIKRKIERRSQHESLELDLKVLSIRKELNQQNVSPEELVKLKEMLLKKKTNTYNDLSVIEPLIRKSNERIITQAEINELAFNEYDKATITLNHVLQELYNKIHGERRKEHEQAQNAWLEYMKKQAEYTSNEYKGGSIQSSVYAFEAIRIIKQRTEEIIELNKDLDIR